MSRKLFASICLLSMVLRGAAKTLYALGQQTERLGRLALQRMPTVPAEKEVVSAYK